MKINNEDLADHLRTMAATGLASNGEVEFLLTAADRLEQGDDPVGYKTGYETAAKRIAGNVSDMYVVELGDITKGYNKALCDVGRMIGDMTKGGNV